MLQSRLEHNTNMASAIPSRSKYRDTDFIVYAVPRSGTSAFVHALNIHPDVLCGMELDFGQHVHLAYPDYFAALPQPTEQRRRILAAHLASKPNPTIIGNKNPRYFLDFDQLEGVLVRLPQLRPIWLYRPASQFVDSWNRRAANEDPSWHAGQTGVFALMELLFCLNTTLRLPRPSLVVPYKSLFLTNPDCIRDLFSYFALETPEHVSEAFRANLFQRVQPDKGPATSYDKAERIIAEALEVDALNRLFDQPTVFSFDSVRPTVERHVNNVSRRVINRFLGLRRDFTPAQQEYYAKWQQYPEVRRSLRGSWLQRTARTILRYAASTRR